MRVRENFMTVRECDCRCIGVPLACQLYAFSNQVFLLLHHCCTSLLHAVHIIGAVCILSIGVFFYCVRVYITSENVCMTE